ncbi:hypothetical protein Tcan_09550 [Toxocara canis]|uniref:SXP/RAL-2 family protein Ani s 5-like cation-binding domain-containing protein n=2 Tax=Toxocara canis TaxID=6265 RepID=A0A0B2VGB4_TOXCA|nr:hypothetical protein Tcan_09550 [Toxocara canis]
MHKCHLASVPTTASKSSICNRLRIMKRTCVNPLLVLFLFLPNIVDAYLHLSGSDHFSSHSLDEKSMVIDVEIFVENSPFEFCGLCSQWVPEIFMKPPDFLKNVNESGYRTFCAIVENQNLTKVQLKDQLERWAKEQGGNVSALFDKYLVEKNGEKNKIDNTMKEIVMNATNLLTQIQQILHNMNLTRKEAKEKIYKLANGASMSVLLVATTVREEAGSMTGEKSCHDCSQPFPPAVPIPGPYGPQVPKIPGGYPFGTLGPLGPSGTHWPNWPSRKGGSGNGNPFNIYGNSYESGFGDEFYNYDY